MMIRSDDCSAFIGTRWAPTSYKWSYSPYKWVTGVIALLAEVIAPLIIGRDPPCTGRIFTAVSVFGRKFVYQRNVIPGVGPRAPSHGMYFSQIPACHETYP